MTSLNPSGSALIYSIYLGGFGEDLATATAADSAGKRTLRTKAMWRLERPWSW